MGIHISKASCCFENAAWGNGVAFKGKGTGASGMLCKRHIKTLPRLSKQVRPPHRDAKRLRSDLSPTVQTKPETNALTVTFVQTSLEKKNKESVWPLIYLTLLIRQYTAYWGALVSPCWPHVCGDRHTKGQLQVIGLPTYQLLFIYTMLLLLIIKIIRFS